MERPKTQAAQFRATFNGSAPCIRRGFASVQHRSAELVCGLAERDVQAAENSDASHNVTKFDQQSASLRSRRTQPG